MAAVVTKTIKPAGGGDYTTLAAWATARLGVALVDTIERAECYAGNCGGMSMPSGTSTDATSRVEIVAAASARHAGVWDATKAMGGVLSSVVDNIALLASGMLLDGGAGAAIENTAALGDEWVARGCVIRSVPASASSYGGARGRVRLESCLLYSDAATPQLGRGAYVSSAYGCTAVGFYRGFAPYSGALVVKDCLTQGCADGFYGTTDAASDYNISDIAGDAPGTHSKTGVVAFKDAAAKDYHLAAADTVARGAGVNLTASGITTDIDGDARPATGAWDIGADQVAESPTPTPGGGRKPWGRDPWGRPAWGRAAWGRAG